MNTIHKSETFVREDNLNNSIFYNPTLIIVQCMWIFLYLVPCIMTTICNIVQILSRCTQYRLAVLDRYPAIHICNK